MGHGIAGPALGDGTAGWQRTHRIRAAGAPAWVDSDPTSAPAPPLAPHLDVQVIESLPFGWTQVRCENGWTTWVDAVSLEAIADVGADPGPGLDRGEPDPGWVQMVAPALREPLPPGGYPSGVWAVIPPSYVPDDAPTMPSVEVPAPRPRARGSRRRSSRSCARRPRRSGSSRSGSSGRRTAGEAPARPSPRW